MSSNFQMLIIYAVVTAGANIVLGITQCNVCEEYTSCTISETLKVDRSNPQQFIWMRQSVDVATCYMNGENECLIYPDFINGTNVSINKGIQSVTLLLTVLNVNRTDSNAISSEGYWTLKTLNNGGSIIHTTFCFLEIYKMFDKADCTFIVIKDSISIICIGSKSFPKGICKFQVKMNEDYGELKPTYNYTLAYVNPDYYTTECSVVLPLKTFEKTAIIYKTTMFLNVSQAKSDVIKETTVNGTINIEYPRIRLISCQDYAQLGNEMHCICKRDDDSDIQTNLLWYSNNDIIEKSKERTVILSVKEPKKNIKYTCRATNILGWSIEVTYQPILVSNNESLKIEKVVSSTENTDNATPEANITQWIMISLLLLILIAAVSVVTVVCKRRCVVKRRNGENNTMQNENQREPNKATDSSFETLEMLIKEIIERDKINKLKDDKEIRYYNSDYY